MSRCDRLLLVLGNQLFAAEHLDSCRDAHVFLAEDFGLCTYVRHHQQKIVLFLAAMRAYRDVLRDAGFVVHYHELAEATGPTYEERLKETIEEIGAREIVHFEIEDRPMEARILDFAESNDLERTELESPMFLCPRARFAEFADSDKSLRMATFYRQERVRLGILVDADKQPAGGRWSFDAENRKKLPADVDPPAIAEPERSGHVAAVVRLVEEHFADHPGRAGDFWWPTTRQQALQWLEDFLAARLEQFGPYEDAMTRRSATVYHSLLSPLLNLGLITPREVVGRALEHADDHATPIASVEGFIRQVIGWREFVRGVYRQFGNEQAERNFWSHSRKLTDSWYDATTGIVPLDDTIDTATRLGWTHHIPRLMVVGNLMTLCEIEPAAAHDWFMEMYVDSSEWVMGPNVFGMALFSDGGLFATKPYICGSNYLRKMSDYGKGDWCDVVDGLYWRFIDKHRDFFEQQPRLALMPKALDRLDETRKTKIFAAAEAFLDTHTA